MEENVIAIDAKSARKPAVDKPLAEPVTLETVAKAAENIPPATVEVSSQNRPGKSYIKKALFAGAAVVAVAAAGYYGNDYWNVGRFHVSTDDAYVKADSSAIAPKVSGYLSKVLVADNQPVKAGQVLATIDGRDYAAALDQARADVAAAKATVDARVAALGIQTSVIAAARASVDVDRANETFAEQNDQRYSKLAVNGNAAVQIAEQASAQLAANRATTARDQATLAGAEKQVVLLDAEIAQAKAALTRDIAVQQQAELNQSYTNIVAPIDGVVGNRTLRVGQYVQAGTQLMTVVPTSAAYIVANYKETQLTDVRPGQPVDVEVDMFPGRTYHGHVESVAPASGQEFALLPPDNATGNFTKVVQRIPVRIVLDAESTASGDLRPGMSVEPSIDIKQSDKSR